MIKNLRCSKCFITMDRLKEDKIADYLIKIVDSEGNEKYICRNCLLGW